MGAGSSPRQPSACLLSRLRASSRPRTRLPEDSVAQTTERRRILPTTRQWAPSFEIRKLRLNEEQIRSKDGYTTVALEYSKGYGTTYPKPVEQVNAALAFLLRNRLTSRSTPQSLCSRATLRARISRVKSPSSPQPLHTQTPVGIQPRLKTDQISAMLLLSGAYDPSAVNFEGDFGWFLKTTLWAISV